MGIFFSLFIETHYQEQDGIGDLVVRWAMGVLTKTYNYIVHTGIFYNFWLKQYFTSIIFQLCMSTKRRSFWFEYIILLCHESEMISKKFL